MRPSDPHLDPRDPRGHHRRGRERPGRRIRDQIAVLNESFNGATGGAKTGFGSSWRDHADHERSGSTCTATAQDAAMKTALKRGGPRDAEHLLGRPRRQPARLGYLAAGRGGGRRARRRGRALPVPAGRRVRDLQRGRHRHPRGGPLARPVPHVRGRLQRPGDFVADTAPEASPGIRLPGGPRHLRGAAALDPITNFMDYTQDHCMFEFTGGQASGCSRRGWRSAPSGPHAMERGPRKGSPFCYPRSGFSV